MKQFSQYLIGAASALAFIGVFAFARDAKPPQMPDNEKKSTRVVFQLTTPDTAAYRALARQLNNLLEGLPKAQIEVVVHNKGIAMLQKQKSNVVPELEALATKGIQFVACEQTMKQQKLEKSDILPLAGFVPRGLVEIIQKQEQGWAYIKAGF
jgi:intracellular sulfur oxidation DsrE/DsrF family protein